MVVHRTCSFCAGEIEPGTGQLFVKRDGSLYSFCSSSCRKQQMGLGRVGHRLRWTHAHELKRLAEQRRQPAATEVPAPAKGEGRKPKVPAAQSAQPKKAGPPAAPKKTAKAKPASEGGAAAAEEAGETPKKPKAKKPASPPTSS
jgi:large subunit ribosomal protein L24e